MINSTRRNGRRGRGDGGAALVEFAIIGPLVFALLLGMFTGGIALSRQNSMTSAIREGARLGATLTRDGPWAESVRDRVRELSSDDLTNEQICVELIKVGEAIPLLEWSGMDCGPQPSSVSTGGIPDGECVVKVWGQRKDHLQVIFFQKELTLSGGSVSLYERDCPE